MQQNNNHKDATESSGERHTKQERERKSKQTHKHTSANGHLEIRFCDIKSPQNQRQCDCNKGFSK